MEKLNKSYPNKYQEGYTKLLTYKQGLEIYQKTKRFTAKYLDKIKESRLIAHMNDSARSVSSNIREGAKRRNTKAYIEFLGFGRASLEELKGDYEELKRELKEGERWGNKDKEGLIRIDRDAIEREIDGLLDLIYGEDCMMGRQIASLEKKMVDDKVLPQKEMIRKGWKAAEEREKRFWDLAKERFGIEKDKEGRIRINKDK